jgi:hypothetical protein
MGKHWLTPPHIYNELDREFHFDYDPCPYPRPDGFNGLLVPWGKSNYVNPPFRQRDAFDGGGPTAFARKAIAEAQHGNGSVLLLPVQSYMSLLVGAGAEVRYIGRVPWLHIETGKPVRNPSSIAVFVLRGRSAPQEDHGAGGSIAQQTNAADGPSAHA